MVSGLRYDTPYDLVVGLQTATTSCAPSLPGITEAALGDRPTSEVLEDRGWGKVKFTSTLGKTVYLIKDDLTVLVRFCEGLCDILSPIII